MTQGNKNVSEVQNIQYDLRLKCHRLPHFERIGSKLKFVQLHWLTESHFESYHFFVALFDQVGRSYY